MKLSTARRALAGSLLLVLPAFATAGNTWYVDLGAAPNGDGSRAAPFTTIWYAMQMAESGDLVLVAPGLYQETIHYLGKAVTLKAAGGPEITVIDGAQAGSVVTFAPLSRQQTRAVPVLEGFTITGGTGAPWNGRTCGGGIFALGSSASIVNCIVSANRADLGAGVFARDAEVSIIGSRIEANMAGRKHFDFPPDKAPALDAPVAQGGGLYASGDSTLRITNTAFRANAAFGPDARGGGLRLVSGTATLVSCRFVGNIARDLRELAVESGLGAGIAAEPGTDLKASDTDFDHNWAPAGGAGAWGVGEFRDCKFRSGRARDGAGVLAVSGEMRLIDCVLEHNEARWEDRLSHGGGVYGPAVLKRCLLRDNTAWGEGGGAFGAELEHCILHDNQALCPDPLLTALGGGAAESKLVHCRVFDNFSGPGFGPLRTKGYGGGAARCDVYGTELLRNRSHKGGGAYNSNLDRCTVSGNTASEDGDGVYFDVALPHRAFQIHNTIVWDNGTSELVDRTPGGIPINYSNVKDLPYRGGVGNISSPPMFWAPAQLDCYLKPGSPCIDTGDPGGPRDPDGSLPDMGALTFDSAHCGQPFNFCLAIPNSLGCTPAIEYSGLPMFGGSDDFLVGATGVPNNTNGMLVWSLSRSYEALPTGCYVGCLQPPFVVTPAQSSAGNPAGADCSGGYSFHFSESYMASQGLPVGTSVYAQYWYRDAGSPPPGGMGRTDALEFTICWAGN